MSNRLCRLAVITAVIMLPLFFSACMGSSDSYQVRKEQTFKALEEIRTTKKRQVIDHLLKIRAKTSGAAEDKVLLRGFETFRRMSHLNLSVLQNRPLSNELDLRYVTHYGEFYDIIFVNPKGDVFYSIKWEVDLGQNLFTGALSNTKLAKSLQASRKPQFIDYDHYSPSNEPASFFTTPVQDGDGKHAGWMVFQFAVNALNSLLADYERLGVTDEVYLLSKDKMMLTQSRLVSDNTPLKLKVETQALELAMRETSGHDLFPDYRNIPVFSSYEKLSVFGTDWIMVAEIDEDEILTRYYRDHQEQLYPQLMKSTGRGRVSERHKPGLNQSVTERVDINEFNRGNKDAVLGTFGVSTCTAVVLKLPESFSYLGHIYPLDQSYLTGIDRLLVEFGLNVSSRGNDSATITGVGDLLGEMLTKAQHFDLYPYQSRKVVVTLVAPHLNGFGKAISKLIDHGFFLNQIKVLYAPEMSYANVIAPGHGPENFISWVDGKGQQTQWRTDVGGKNMGQLVRNLLRRQTLPATPG